MFLLEKLGKKLQKETHNKYNTQQDLLDCFITLIDSLIEENQAVDKWYHLNVGYFSKT